MPLMRSVSTPYFWCSKCRDVLREPTAPVSRAAASLVTAEAWKTHGGLIMMPISSCSRETNIALGWSNFICVFILLKCFWLVRNQMVSNGWIAFEWSEFKSFFLKSFWLVRNHMVFTGWIAFDWSEFKCFFHWNAFDWSEFILLFDG